LEYQQLRICYIFIKQSLRSSCGRFQEREAEFCEYVFHGLKANKKFHDHFRDPILKIYEKVLCRKKIDDFLNSNFIENFTGNENFLSPTNSRSGRFLQFNNIIMFFGKLLKILSESKKKKVINERGLKNFIYTFILRNFDFSTIDDTENDEELIVLEMDLFTLIVDSEVLSYDWDLFIKLCTHARFKLVIDNFYSGKRKNCTSLLPVHVNPTFFLSNLTKI
jgi:hypothetical protein